MTQKELFWGVQWTKLQVMGQGKDDNAILTQPINSQQAWDDNTRVEVRLGMDL